MSSALKQKSRARPARSPRRVAPDRDGLFQTAFHILTNLLSNAMKYSDAGQPVELMISRRGKAAIFRVADHGCGIPAADQARLFQAFHRASNVRQLPGTGLGLVIVKRSVALHGGEIEFQSTEGKGTTFTVRLPMFS